MRPMRIAIPFAAVLATFLTGPASAQKHPHYDDQGTLQWHTTFAAAKEDARKADKLIFVEVGATT
jgi:hypothetical protein